MACLHAYPSSYACGKHQNGNYKIERTAELLLGPKPFSIGFTDASDQVPAACSGIRKTHIARPLSDHIEAFKPRQRSAPPLSSKNV